MKGFFWFVVMLPVVLFAQPIPNGNFETWISTPYDGLNNWRNSNPESILNSGLPTVFKTADSYSGFAVKLQTVSNGVDTSFAYFVNSDGDPLAGEGGFPYSQMPTHISGYYKYDLPAQDTALLLVVFKNSGIVLSTDLFKIKGTGQQLNYTFFSFPLSLTQTPDSVIVAATSSNVISGQGIEPGSTLYLDQLVFTGSGSMPLLFNGDFESWSTFHVDQLSGWNFAGDGSHVSKSTDSYEGTFALELESVMSGTDPSVAAVTTGYFTNPGGNGGRPFTNQVDTLSGYYKYANSSGDQAVLFVNISKNGSGIGFYSLPLPPVSIYTYFEIPIFLPVVPDSMRVDIQSSEYPYMNIGSGSTLLMDDLQLSSAPLTPVVETRKQPIVVTFPNPAVDEFYLMPANQFHGSFRFVLDDVAGQEVLLKQVQIQNPGEIVKMDLQGISPGIYFYSIPDLKDVIKGKLIKQ